MTRIYLPLSPEQLARLVSDRVLAGPLAAFAVTDGLRRAWTPAGAADLDELEYAALMAAADACRELAGAPTDRRLVLAADAPAVEDRGAEHPAAVVADQGLAWTQVASAHVDLAPGADPDDDLAWFAPEEIPGLV